MVICITEKYEMYKKCKKHSFYTLKFQSIEHTHTIYFLQIYLLKKPYIILHHIFMLILHFY
jgi:hypothetical protein